MSGWITICGAQWELMIISAIIAVCNPDNCHPHLVRLRDRLWTCGAEMCPPPPTHTHTHTHRHAYNAMYHMCTSHNAVMCSTLCSTVWGKRPLLRRAAGEPVGSGTQPTPAWREQGRGGAPEAETPHAKEPWLRPVLPLQAPTAPPRSGVRETCAHTTGTSMYEYLTDKLSQFMHIQALSDPKPEPTCDIKLYYGHPDPEKASEGDKSTVWHSERPQSSKLTSLTQFTWKMSEHLCTVSQWSPEKWPSSLHLPPLSWSSCSVSWLECWGKETPTRLATRSSSARTTAPAARPPWPAPATHLPHPPTTSSEFIPTEEENIEERQAPPAWSDQWRGEQTEEKAKKYAFMCECACVRACACVCMCVYSREGERDIQFRGGDTTVKSTLEWRGIIERDSRLLLGLNCE